jgi:hypothetical protein
MSLTEQFPYSIILSTYFLSPDPPLIPFLRSGSRDRLAKVSQMFCGSSDKRPQIPSDRNSAYQDTTAVHLAT